MQRFWLKHTFQWHDNSCLDFNQMNYMPFIDPKIQWWARPFYAFWDWDRDFWILVSKFETETETLEISLIFWDWYWDFGLLVSKNETETETLMLQSQSLRPRLRPPWSQSQSRDQSLAHLCKTSSWSRSSSSTDRSSNSS